MRSSLLRILLSVPLTFSTINVANTETRRLQFKIEPIIILNCIEQVNYTINTNQLASAGRTRRSDAPRAIVTQSARQINANFAVDQVVDEPNDKSEYFRCIESKRRTRKAALQRQLFKSVLNPTRTDQA